MKTKTDDRFIHVAGPEKGGLGVVGYDYPTQPIMFREQGGAYTGPNHPWCRDDWGRLNVKPGYKLTRVGNSVIPSPK